MSIVQVAERELYLVDGKRFDSNSGSVIDDKFGITYASVKKLSDKKRRTEIAQLFSLVGDGLVLTQHIFKGLNRGLSDDCDSSNNGHDRLVCSWRSLIDIDCPSSDHRFIPVKKRAPDNSVFAVILSPNTLQADKYPDIKFWISMWNWCNEDPVLIGAPVDWVDRYTEKLWSK